VAETFYSLADKWAPQAGEVAPRVLLPLPEGIYVLRDTLPTTSDSGANLMSLGTEVRIVGEGNGKLVLTDGIDRVLVERSMITKDPKEAYELKQKAAKLKSMLTSESRTALQHRLDGVIADIKRLESELRIVQQRDAVAKANGTAVKLGTDAGFLQVQITREEAKAVVLRQQLHALPAATTPVTPPNMR
jgi:hypothetical protein